LLISELESHLCPILISGWALAISLKYQKESKGRILERKNGSLKKSLTILLTAGRVPRAVMNKANELANEYKSALEKLFYPVLFPNANFL
jgi:hypothetical protein